MGTWDKINHVWKNVQEVDLRPIRKEAEQIIWIAIVGTDQEEMRALATQLGTDPWRPEAKTHMPLLLVDLEEAESAGRADLIVVLADPGTSDLSREQNLVKDWCSAGKRVIVLISPASGMSDPKEVQLYPVWATARMVIASSGDRETALEDLANAVLDILPAGHLSLGRHFPLLRAPVVRRLINDTAFSNAAYSLSTGIAEIVPVLGLPLNIADIIVLTKAQALLVYRLGLVLGLSPEWRFYIGEFGSVIGGSFLWRQVARQLVGLIPVWGIIPKVGVAYAGTYTVGHVVLQWYQTGKHLTRKELRALYRQSFERGKEVARALADRLPRRKARRAPRTGRRFRFRGRRGESLPAPGGSITCVQCQAENDADANYCKNCGQALAGASATALPE